MKKNISLILSFTFMDYLSLSLIFGTLMPLVLAKDSFFQLKHAQGTHPLLYGSFLLLLPIGQLVFGPVWGQLSDFYGRKKVLLITLFLSSVGYSVMALAIINHTLFWFVIGRLISAMVSINMALGQASLGDQSVGHLRAGRFNLQFIMVSLGFIVGPWLIDLVSNKNAASFSNVYAFLSIAYLSLVGLVYVYFSESNTVSEKTRLKGFDAIRSGLFLFKAHALLKIFVVWMIFQMGWHLFFQYGGAFLFEFHHLSNTKINHFFSLLGFLVLVMQICLVQPLTKIIQPKKIVPWSLLAIGVGLIGMGFSSFHWPLFAFLGIYCLGIAFFLTNNHVYIADLVVTEHLGLVMAMLGSTQALINFIVTGVGGVLMTVFLPTPFLIGGSLVLLGLLVFVWVI